MEIRIFMQKKVLLYHYTKYSALCEILKNNSLRFRASRFDQMNDPEEFKFSKKWCYKVYKQEIGDYDTELTPYVVSFSRNNDSLLMWRLYNAKICLVLDEEIVKNHLVSHLGMNICDIQYCQNEIKSITTAIEQIAYDCNFPIDDIHEEIQIVSSFIKKQDFACEKEVRIVTTNRDGLQISNIDDEIAELFIPEVLEQTQTKLRDNGSKYQYKEIDLPKEALQGIIVYAPNKSEFKRIKKNLSDWLISNGYSEDLIMKTKSSQIQ